VWCRRTFAYLPEPVAPLLDGEIAAAQPGQRQQLLELVVVLVEEKAPQLLEGRVIRVVLEDAVHHVLVRGIVELIGRDLDIELARLGDHETDLLQADVELGAGVGRSGSDLAHAGLAPFLTNESPQPLPSDTCWRSGQLTAGVPERIAVTAGRSLRGYPPTGRPATSAVCRSPPPATRIGVQRSRGCFDLHQSGPATSSCSARAAADPIVIRSDQQAEKAHAMGCDPVRQLLLQRRHPSGRAPRQRLNQYMSLTVIVRPWRSCGLRSCGTSSSRRDRLRDLLMRGVASVLPRCVT
jgi:hypothetical protein